MSDEHSDIHVDELDLRDGGFTIGATTFRVDPSMDGPVWRFSPNGVVHGQSTLTRDTILQQIEKAEGRPLEVLAAPSLVHVLVAVLREVVVEVIRRGWTVLPASPAEVGEATTFTAEDKHAISGLDSNEASVLQAVLKDIRTEPDGAVVILGAEEKKRHQEFVEALNAGALPIFIHPEAAVKCIRRRSDGSPVLAFGRFPDTEISDSLAFGIDKALRDAAPPLRAVDFDGPVKVEIDDTNENAGLPDQPIVGGDIVAPKLEDLHGSVVGLILTDSEGGTIKVDGKLTADSYGYAGDEVEPGEPPEVKVGAFDLLQHLWGLEGKSVSFTVTETERRGDDAVQPAIEDDPKSPEGDLLGKVRVALAAAKLIQENRTYYETPDGEADHYGTPTRENSVVVTKLDEALMWAERDAEKKVEPPAPAP